MSFYLPGVRQTQRASDTYACTNIRSKKWGEVRMHTERHRKAEALESRGIVAQGLNMQLYGAHNYSRKPPPTACGSMRSFGM